MQEPDAKKPRLNAPAQPQLNSAAATQAASDTLHGKEAAAPRLAPNEAISIAIVRAAELAIAAPAADQAAARLAAPPERAAVVPHQAAARPAVPQNPATAAAVAAAARPTGSGSEPFESYELSPPRSEPWLALQFIAAHAQNLK